MASLVKEPIRRVEPLRADSTSDLPYTGGERVAFSSQERVRFARSLAVLYEAGVRLDRALALLARQAETGTRQDRSYSGAYARMAQGLQHGKLLSQVVSQFTSLPPLTMTLLQTGEKSGNLDFVLRQWAHYEEKRDRIQRRVASSLVYPLFVSSLVLLLLLTFPALVLGGLIDSIRETGVQLPLASRAIFLFCDLMRSGLFWLSLPCLALAGALWAGIARLAADRHRKNFRQFVQKGVEPTYPADSEVRPFELWPRWARRGTERIQKLPGIRQVIQYRSVCLFARTLALQLRAGVPWDQAVPHALKATGSPTVTAATLRQAKDQLAEGREPEEVLASSGLFPESFLKLLRAGSEAGKSDEMAEYLAGTYESELEYRLEQALAMLDPIIILLLGSTVGVVLVGVLLPMTQLLAVL